VQDYRDYQSLANQIGASRRALIAINRYPSKNRRLEKAEKAKRSCCASNISDLSNVERAARDC